MNLGNFRFAFCIISNFRDFFSLTFVDATDDRSQLFSSLLNIVSIPIVEDTGTIPFSFRKLIEKLLFHLLGAIADGIIIRLNVVGFVAFLTLFFYQLDYSLSHFVELFKFVAFLVNLEAVFFVDFA